MSLFVKMPAESVNIIHLRCFSIKLAHTLKKKREASRAAIFGSIRHGVASEPCRQQRHLHAPRALLFTPAIIQSFNPLSSHSFSAYHAWAELAIGPSSRGFNFVKCACVIAHHRQMPTLCLHFLPPDAGSWK